MPPDAAELWNIIIPDVAPETVLRPRGLPIIQSTASGQLDVFKVAVSYQPGRFDIVAGLVDETFAPQAVTTPLALLERGETLMAGLLDRLAISRVAIVLDVYEPADGEEDACRRINRELPFLAVPPHTRDVNYQVNPTLGFRADRSIRMFRLCRWSTALMQLISIPVTAFAAGGDASTPVEQRHVLLYQMDLSSAPGRADPLDSGKVRGLFSELGAEVRRLLDQGFRRFQR